MGTIKLGLVVLVALLFTIAPVQPKSILKSVLTDFVGLVFLWIVIVPKKTNKKEPKIHPPDFLTLLPPPSTT